MQLRFLDSEELYTIENGINSIASTKLCIYQSNIPEKTCGFELITDEGEIISYFNYTVVYAVSKKESEDDYKDDYIIFSCDTRIHHVYYLYDEDGYVISYISSVTTPIENNVILIRSGIGSNYETVPLEEFVDDEFYPKYKVVDGLLVDVTEDDLSYIKAKRLDEAKAEKIDVFSIMCKENIEKGVEHNGDWYSYTLEDQNNLEKSCNYAMTTGLEAPYHANGCACKLYSVEDIFAIYQAQTVNLTHNETYYNQLKMYIMSLTSVEDVTSVEYGQELTGEYLENYNMIMEQTQKIIEAYTSSLSI